MNEDIHSQTRSECLTEITRRSMRGSPVKLREFASNVAKVYRTMVTQSAQIVDFHSEDGSINAICRAENANYQIVNRFLKGEVKFPADLEESWVMCLPQPFRDEAVGALAARYGLAAARKPGDGREAQSDFAKMMHKYADLVDDMSKLLADGKIKPNERALVGKTERDVDALIAELITLRGACRKALGVKTRAR